MAKSIMQADKECYLCRKLYNIRTVRGLECHHIFPGVARRDLCERFGLKVWLCHRHHNEPPIGVHHNAAAMHELQADAQRVYDARYGDGALARDMGKNYL